MRKYLRRIAHAKMRAEGICHPNKKRHDYKGRTTPSFFAENWRKYTGKN